MTTTIAYYAVLFATFLILVNYGGRTGLWGGALQIVTSLLSLFLAMAFNRSAIVIPLMYSVDFLSLGWKLALAFLSDRRWPIWVAAFQVNVVAAHVAIWLVPKWESNLYYAMVTVWAIPTLLVMIVGTMLDHRHQVKASARAKVA